MPLSDVERLKEEAARLHAAGDVKRAVEVLTRAIKLANSRDQSQEQPKFLEKRGHLLSVLYSNRAGLRALQHEYVEALVDAKAAIQNDPSWPKPWLRKATALLGLGQPHAALQVVDRGIAACSDQAWALESVKADIEVAAATQQRAAKRQRCLPPPMLLHDIACEPLSPANGHNPHLSNGNGATKTAQLSSTDNSHSAESGVKGAQATAAGKAGVQGGPELVAHALNILDKAYAARGLQPGPQREADKVPITIISGFLGAGKTTLLKRILAAASDTGAAPTTAPTHTNTIHTDTPKPTAARKLYKFGVVVNDMAAIGIDGILAKDAAALHAMAAHVRPGDIDSSAVAASNVVEMANGCICCGLKGDMLLEVAQLLCSLPSLNYLVIESTGVGQPLPVAAAFASEDTRGRSLLDYVRLDCLVTVVDAPRFHEDMRAAHTPATAAAASRLLSAALPEDMSTAATTAAPAAGAAVGPAGASTSHNVPEPRAVMSGDPNLIDAEDNRPLAELLAEQSDAEDNRPLAELLAEQVEYADVVLVNKFGSSGTSQQAAAAPGPATAAESECSVRQITEIIQTLNPRAHIIPTNYCDVPLSEVIDTHRFDFESASVGARWQQELLKAHDDSEPHTQDESATSQVHETEVYGITSAVYESRRPFHPGRFRDWLNTGLLCAMEPGVDHTHAKAVAAASAAQLIQPQLPAKLLRSKGFFWLASCPQVAWEWSSAGAAGRPAPYGEWLAGKLPRRCWPEPGRRAGWDPVWGDRRSALVFIAHGKADLSVIKSGLDACLLTDAEINMCDPPSQTATAAPAAAAAAAANGIAVAEVTVATAGDSKTVSGQAKGVCDECDAVCEDVCEEEEGESEDSVWYRKEQAWAQLAGAVAWEALLD